MELPSTGIVKYHVKLSFEVDGLVEKADIIGAIFGQTEGLLGPEMNLNELQKVSKVGRIEVNVDTKSNIAKGDALIPMSTDISTAALIAAAIASIDKVGPFQAHFIMSGIDDIRAGFDNAIAIEGAKIDETITHLTQGKKVIAFLDRDRAGDLILKELQGLVSIDKVYRAPQGREVEECTPLEISEILGNIFEESKEDTFPRKQTPFPQKKYHKTEKDKPVFQQSPQKIPQSNNVESILVQTNNAIKSDTSPNSTIRDIYSQINETLKAIVLDGSMNTIIKVPVSELVKKLDEISGGKILILDGIVTQRLIDASDKAGIEQIVGHRLADIKRNSSLKINTFSEIGLP